MTKVFIEKFHCKTPCEIFVGKDALSHALFWIRYGCMASDASQLYHFTHPLLSAISWRKGSSSYPAKKEVEGNGVHLKMYEVDSYLILSSQNNGHSSLFESAMVFKRKNKLSEFFSRCFVRATNYSTWWKQHSKYFTR